MEIKCKVSFTLPEELDSRKTPPSLHPCPATASRSNLQMMNLRIPKTTSAMKTKMITTRMTSMTRTIAMGIANTANISAHIAASAYSTDGGDTHGKDL